MVVRALVVSWSDDYIYRVQSSTHDLTPVPVGTHSSFKSTVQLLYLHLMDLLCSFHHLHCTLEMIADSPGYI